jgi:hypothetical protein
MNEAQNKTPQTFSRGGPCFAPFAKRGIPRSHPSGNFVDSTGTLPYFTFVDRTLFDTPVSSRQEFSQ